MSVLLIVLVVVAALVVIGGGSLLLLSPRRTASGKVSAPRSGVDLDEGGPGHGQGTVLDAAARVLEEAEREPAAQAPAEVAPAEAPEVGAPPRLAERLGRTRGVLSGYLGSLRRRTKIDAATFDELEESLILADVGLPTTTRILDDLRARATAGELGDGDAVLAALKEKLSEIIGSGDRSLHRVAEGEGPSVWLFVGVNGVGKTTTIGKVAGARQVAEGHKVVLAAGDTFRAAAGEQLEMWAERAGARLVSGSPGADPSSVVFDAVQSAAARGADLVLADTAGRLHTKFNLMEELKKVRRVADRPPATVTEVLLVLDATTGQNGLTQAREFGNAVDVTGVVLTKLDGSAKGGIVLAIAAELGVPIKLVGLGEKIEDLVEFDPEEFVDALLSPG